MRPVAGNRVTLLRNGAEFFPALLAAVDSASDDVRLEAYIFADDVVGRAVGEALKRAAQRGAKVRLMVDGFGSRELSPGFIGDLRSAGVVVQLFRPERGWFSFRRSRLRRLHRKIALIDGRIGFVGGINILDDHTGHGSPAPRYDYAVRVEGPLLAEIYPVVHRLWWLVAALTRKERQPGFLPPEVHPAPAGDTAAVFVFRDNFRHRHDIETMYLDAIRGARREILIACAYFMPGWRVRHALMEATARGVRVAIVVQGWSDHRVFQHASRVLYGALLDHGIEIYEYERSEMHAKAAVADGRWATVGSSNLDPFSLFLAREANVAVLSEAFARELRESIDHEIHHGARAVPRLLWKRRPWITRFAGWLAYGYARLAMGIAGIGRRWY
ncbi:MAG TPA: cardiolipin synthase ClsB [Usitatibacteraceae bacterium]|nr:cardiolipin synthase ClsB [Usitatibacteraceae bacterium]